MPNNLLLFFTCFLEIILYLCFSDLSEASEALYFLQLCMILGISITRENPIFSDSKIATNIVVGISLTYPIAIIFSPQNIDSSIELQKLGSVLIILGTLISIISILSLNNSFGVRPSLRKLKVSGIYAFVRHPIYMSYILSDIGMICLRNSLTVLFISGFGWFFILLRIRAEENILQKSMEWDSYKKKVRYKLIPFIY